MRYVRFAIYVALLSVSTAAYAQSAAPKGPVVQSEAKTAFNKLKSLEGAWEGTVTTVPQQGPIEGKPVKVWLRVTSMGNVIMHEMKPSDLPDNPITMLYLEDERLLLTHYCDAGNRPRMAGKASADGKTVDFDFIDIANYSSKQGGHMKRAVFTTIDDNRHIEEWTFMMKGDQPVRARFDLRRVQKDAAGDR
jgi:hypothetical protein